MQKLSEIIVLEYGKGLKTSQRTGGKYPVIGSSGIIGWHDEYLIEGPGIVIGRKGSIGEVTFIKQNFWPIDTAYYVKLRKNLNLSWLAYLLEKINLKKLGLSDVVPGLKRELVYNQTIMIPVLKEQTAIANILSTVDEAIGKADEAVKKTERIKQAMLRKLLTEGIGHTEFKETKIGKIPKEWEYVKLNKYVCILGGFAFKSSDYATAGIPLIRIANVSFGEIIFDDLVYLPKIYVDKFAEYKINTNDILLALTRPIISGGLKAGIINSGQTPALLNQRVAKINCRNEKELLPNYLKHYILSTYFFNQMLQTQTSTNQPNVSTKQIENFNIIVPKPDEQKKISKILDDLQEKISLSVKRKRYLKKIKQGLMDDLLTGKKRVKM